MPLVVEAASWEDGVYMAATMGSETTAAATGKVGEVRRDPFAMLPFCGYHIGDYFRHWLAMGRAVPHAAEDFQRQLVPHRRRRQVRMARLRPEHARAQVDRGALPRAGAAAWRARSGLQPEYGDIDWDGLEFSEERFDEVMRIDRARWQQELAAHDQLFAKLGAKQPEALAALRRQLGAKLAL